MNYRRAGIIFCDSHTAITTVLSGYPDVDAGRGGRGRWTQGALDAGSAGGEKYRVVSPSAHIWIPIDWWHPNRFSWSKWAQSVWSIWSVSRDHPTPNQQGGRRWGTRGARGDPLRDQDGPAGAAGGCGAAEGLRGGGQELLWDWQSALSMWVRAWFKLYLGHLMIFVPFFSHVRSASAAGERPYARRLHRHWRPPGLHDGGGPRKVNNREG